MCIWVLMYAFTQANMHAYARIHTCMHDMCTRRTCMQDVRAGRVRGVQDARACMQDVRACVHVMIHVRA